MKTIIIGGGASGLVAAITAAGNGADVTILEKENKPGKKILVTGNGKCNITNTNMDETKYYGDTAFVKSVLNVFGYKETIEFFESCGIFTKNKNGYIYPASEQALTVLNRLRDVAINFGVKIKTNNAVENIHITENGFEILAGIKLYCDKLIIATGGCAAPKTGSDGSGYDFARKMGHTIIAPSPALTGIICEKASLNKAAGVRVAAKVFLEDQNSVIGSNIGELQITDYGISGIPVFNISRLAEKDMNVYIDFEPHSELCDVKTKINSLLKNCSSMSILATLNGMFNEKISAVLLEECDIDKNQKSSDINDEQINKICYLVKRHPLTVKSTRPFQYAQVTKGGVNTNEIDCKTMESKIVKNLYFAGEIIDIDGICGGYNLQFAWATGAIAGGNCF